MTYVHLIVAVIGITVFVNTVILCYVVKSISSLRNLFKKELHRLTETNVAPKKESGDAPARWLADSFESFESMNRRGYGPRFFKNVKKKETRRG